ncbi:MAG TPA: TIGR03668 family PPOX class F420-dependent oxidoreductase [Thermodesulfobacteriota bacterium]|nr:TIGR03668 family PPOX class F420-dependent oxidoreductase [Thermodesulfobacteriota bacterium]
MIMLTDGENQFILSHRVARLATVDRFGKPLVVPICYAYDGMNIYTPIDKKPKRVSVRGLKRIKNIMENPYVSLVIDEYHEDWDKLSYIIIHGKAELIESGQEYQESLRLLTQKYVQYERMNLTGLNLPVIKIIPERIISWRVV